MNSVRKTVQRQLIYDAVRELDIHATAEQVYEYIILKHPTISKATVYRNLHQMSESGELLDIGTFYGSTHYDHRIDEHHHFVCEDCYQVFDVDGDYSDVLDRTQDNQGFDVSTYQLSFGGTCWGCKEPEPQGNAKSCN